MIASDFRAEARRILSGKWGKAALITLAYSFILFAANFVQGLFDKESTMASIISICIAIIEVPLSFGLILAFYNLYKGNEVHAFDFLSLGFSNFQKSWNITFRMALKLIVPIILIVIAVVLLFGAGFSMFAAGFSTSSSASASYGTTSVLLIIVAFVLMIVGYILIITKSYYYKMAYIVAAEDPSISAADAVDRSKQLMTGNRWRLFCLELSFIGWSFLAGLTFGIGFLWLLPYIQIATFVFYSNLSGNNGPVVTGNSENMNN